MTRYSVSPRSIKLFDQLFVSSPDELICQNGYSVSGRESEAARVNRLTHLRRRFIVPVESDATSKATEKAAAQSRSTIRRQRTIRGGEGRRRRWLSMVTDSNNEASENRRSSSSSNSEQEETRDILSYERYRLSRSGSDDQSMPPVPESRDYEDRGNENTNFMNNVRRRQRQRDEQHVRELMAHSRASRDPARRIAQPGSAQPWVSNRVELSPTPEASPPRHTVTDADELVSQMISLRLLWMLSETCRQCSPQSMSLSSNIHALTIYSAQELDR